MKTKQKKIIYETQLARRVNVFRPEINFSNVKYLEYVFEQICSKHFDRHTLRVCGSVNARDRLDIFVNIFSSGNDRTFLIKILQIIFVYSCS